MSVLSFLADFHNDLQAKALLIFKLQAALAAVLEEQAAGDVAQPDVLGAGAGAVQGFGQVQGFGLRHPKAVVLHAEKEQGVVQAAGDEDVNLLLFLEAVFDGIFDKDVYKRQA